MAAEGFELLNAELRERSEGDMGVGYVEFALAHPQRFRLMFGGLLRFDDYPELRAAGEGRYEDLQEVFGRPGRRCAAGGGGGVVAGARPGAA